MSDCIWQHQKYARPEIYVVTLVQFPKQNAKKPLIPAMQYPEMLNNILNRLLFNFKKCSLLFQKLHFSLIHTFSKSSKRILLFQKFLKNVHILFAVLQL